MLRENVQAAEMDAVAGKHLTRDAAAAARGASIPVQGTPGSVFAFFLQFICFSMASRL